MKCFALSTVLTKNKPVLNGISQITSHRIGYRYANSLAEAIGEYVLTIQADSAARGFDMGPIIHIAIPDQEQKEGATT